MTRARRARPVVLTVVTAGLLLSGCSSAGPSSGAGMMGGSQPMHYAAQTCSAPTSLPGAVVRATLMDMGMNRLMGGQAPRTARMRLLTDRATVPAGVVSVTATNLGWRTHELVILPLAADTAVGARVPDASGRVDETGSLGEASGSCVGGAGEGIVSGAVGWVSVTLPKGRYELLCNLPNHYADGMYTLLEVG